MLAKIKCLATIAWNMYLVSLVEDPKITKGVISKIVP